MQTNVGHRTQLYVRVQLGRTCLFFAGLGQNVAIVPLFVILFLPTNNLVRGHCLSGMRATMLDEQSLIMEVSSMVYIIIMKGFQEKTLRAKALFIQCSEVTFLYNS